MEVNLKAYVLTKNENDENSYEVGKNLRINLTNTGGLHISPQTNPDLIISMGSDLYIVNLDEFLEALNLIKDYPSYDIQFIRA